MAKFILKQLDDFYFIFSIQYIFVIEIKQDTTGVMFIYV
jgi:hypothetical protein